MNENAKTWGGVVGDTGLLKEFLMNESHDTWMQDSVQHATLVRGTLVSLISIFVTIYTSNTLQSTVDSDDPNAWLHERLGANTSSTATNGYDQSRFVNGFEQQTPQPYYSYSNPPIRSSMASSAASFDSPSRPYQISTETTNASAAGALASTGKTSESSPIQSSIGSSIASTIGPSSVYYNPYLPPGSTYTYNTNRSAADPTALRPVYTTTWSSLSGATTPANLPSTSEPHPQITIE
jgi:hypothetical protein